MATLTRLSNAVSRTSIGAAVVGFLAVYVFHLGEWAILGTRIYTIFAFSVMVALINAFLNDLFFSPGLSGEAATLAKQSIMLTDDGSISPGQISFANEVIDVVDKREKLACRLSAIIGLIAYFSLGPRIGSLISEFVSLVIFLFLPLILLVPLQGQLMRLKALDPIICDSATQLYSDIHIALSNGTI